jgi:hypothetical protein
MRKKIFLIFIFVALASGAYFSAISGGVFSNKSVPAGTAVVSQDQPKAVVADIATNEPAGSAIPSSLLSQVQDSVVQPVNQNPTELSDSAPLLSGVHITFSAGQSSYPADVKDGSTVYDAMLTLASTTNFSFKSQYYSGIGYFIKEINNQPNEGGTYWTLYINGKYSNVGASEYRLKSGDSVEWKYEKQ